MNMTNLSKDMLTISGTPYAVFPGPILPSWISAAEAKGFQIAGRVLDRLHLALRCKRCGALNKVKRFTLMSAQPLCHACIQTGRRADAATAGLTFLRRDPSDRHYDLYRAPCGHEVRRQTGLVKQMAAGRVGIRCETCHEETEGAEARVRGWALIGPDPAGDPSYRAYRHDDCGHEQRIARANMQSGRLSCGNCGEDWPAAPSYLYAMAFTLATGREVVKLGFSRNPESRLTWQLQRDAEMPCELLRKVAVRSGQMAIRAEKAMHGELKRRYREAVLHPSHWQGQIRVKSEIYDGSLIPIILAMLDRLETEQQAEPPVVPAD